MHKQSSIKSFKELFNRSFKQIYIIIIGLLASILFFINNKSPKFKLFTESINFFYWFNK